MSFVSFTFAAPFAVVLALRLAFDRLRWRVPRIATPVISSLVFFAWAVPWLTLLLLGVAVVGHVAGRAIGGAPPRSRRAHVGVAVGAALGGLAFFKYADHLRDAVVALETAAGAPGRLPQHLGLVLPLGIPHAAVTAHGPSKTVIYFKF
jgi:hypothetical protein